MDLAALDIKIGADLSELQKDLGSAGTYVDTFAKNLATIGSSSAAAAGGMSEIAKGANQISEAFKGAPSYVSALEDSINALANEFDAKWGPIVDEASKLPPVLNASAENAQKLQTQFAAFGRLTPFKNAGTELSKFSLASKPIPANLQNTAKASNTATLALGNLGRVVQDLPFGFVGISNNLNPLLEGFQRLSAEAKTTGTSVSSLLLKSLTGPGGLGIALSVVSAALTLASFGLGAWTRGFGKNKEEIDKAKEALDGYLKNAAGEIADLRVLEKVATDTTNAYSTRKKAVDELQKSYPAYLGNLSDEAILNGEAAKQINLVADALAKKAFLQASESTLTSLANKQLQARKEEYDLTGKQQQLELDLAKARIDAAKAGPVLGGSTFGAGTDESGGERIIKNINAQLENTKKKLEDNKKAQTGVNNEFQYYLNIAEQLKAETIQLDPDPNGKVAKTTKDIETIADVLAKLRLELKALDVRELNEGLNLSKEKINKIEDVITDLITHFKVDQNDTIIQKLFGDINAIKFSLPNFKTFIQEFEKGIKQETPPKIPIEIKPVYDKAAFDDAVKRAQVDIAAKTLHLDIDTSAFSGNEVGILSDQLQELNYINGALQRDFGIGLPASVAKALAAFRQAVTQANALYEANVALNDFVNNYAIASFEALGDAIGTALGGGEFENLFTALFKTLAEGLKVLGDTMIKAGVEIIAIKLALNTLNPVLAIAAGIALRALGSFVESKAPHLAGGGIIPPGYDGDRFPAMLNSGEAVIPLDKLKDYINPTGEPIVFIPETRLSGNDIVIAYERTTRKNKRTY